MWVYTRVFCLALDALVDVLGSHFFVGTTYELYSEPSFSFRTVSI